MEQEVILLLEEMQEDQEVPQYFQQLHQRVVEVEVVMVYLMDLLLVLQEYQEDQVEVELL